MKKRKIHIITVYDSLNYGSYFQALALKSELSQYAETDFLDVHHQNLYKMTFIEVIRELKKFNFKSALLKIKRLLVFKRAHRKIVTTDINSSLNKEDVFVFGSDEIWNISRDKIKKSREFFGVGIPDKHRIALATSINRTKFEQLSSLDYVTNELNKFSAISIRDQYTKDVIEKLLGRHCELVSDPTLLHDASFYDKIKVSIKSDNKFILIYSYGEMLTENVKAKIIRFAKEKGLKIISVGTFFSFCDRCVSVSPNEFLGYVSAAEYIFTDTFHGLMFSLIFNKQFVIFPCGNVKVEDTLTYLELGYRICKQTDSLNVITNKRLNYQVINKKLSAYSNLTRKFIAENIVGLL